VGRPSFPALGYFAEQADEQLAGIGHLVCVDCPSPVAFFAYPGRPSSLVPPGAAVHHLGDPAQDVVAALEALADRVAPDAAPTLIEAAPTECLDPDALLDAAAIGRAVGATLPPDAVVIDEAITSRIALAAGTVAAAPHDWLALTGGAIGEGLPLATGAALAASDRRIVALQADGSAMYTIQALWTQARHRLGVTNVILNNRAYAILQVEMQRIVGRTPGPRAAPLLDLAGPDLDFVALAAGMGVPGERVETVGQLIAALARANAASGPYLIDALMT
jgi:acetolactate synthase-1/2/3 large subunit